MTQGTMLNLQFGEDLMRKYTYTVCYDIPRSEASKAQAHMDNTRTAHARQRREIQTTITPIPYDQAQPLPFSGKTNQ